MNKLSKGRKQGSMNRVTLKTKEQLREAIMPEIDKVFKNISSVEHGQRLSILIKFLPYLLAKGKVSNEESEVQEILYKQLLPHYNKIGIYFCHLPPELKSKMLLQCLKMLTPQQISTVAPVITKQLRGRDKGRDK